MAKGTCCSAAQVMASASSSSFMAGSRSFLVITECPARETTASFPWTPDFRTTSRIAELTVGGLWITPSTMASGGSETRPKAPSSYPAGDGRSWIALTLDDPTSRPNGSLRRDEKMGIGGFLESGWLSAPVVRVRLVMAGERVGPPRKEGPRKE